MKLINKAIGLGTLIGSLLFGGYNANAAKSNAVFNVDQAKTLRWNFMDQYKLDTSANNGTITGSSTNWYDDGTAVSLTATPNSGYRFSRWTGDVPSGSISNNPVNLTMSQARTIQALFDALGPTSKYYNIVVLPTVNGTITPSGTNTVLEGGSLEFLIVGNTQGSKRYELDKAYTDGTEIPGLTGGRTNTYTLANITRDGTLGADFKRISSPVNDYDDDGRSDFAVFDSNTGWWYALSADQATVLTWALQWGWPGAWPVPGDYDGDGKADCAVFDQNTGWWYVITLDGRILAWAFQWGWPGAWPVWGDYDGDGLSDCAVFDQNTGWWYVISLNGTTPLAWAFQWGWPGAMPVPGDYDGDGKADCAVFDQYTGCWYVTKLDGTVLVWAVSWGWPGAISVPGDYDGDCKSDLAVFDSNTGSWFVLSSDTKTVLVWGVSWGWPGAVPVPGDYDGDGISDLAVFCGNTGNWYVIKTDGSLLVWAVPWGWPGAVPPGGRY